MAVPKEIRPPDRSGLRRLGRKVRALGRTAARQSIGALVAIRGFDDQPIRIHDLGALRRKAADGLYRRAVWFPPG